MTKFSLLVSDFLLLNFSVGIALSLSEWMYQEALFSTATSQKDILLWMGINLIWLISSGFYSLYNTSSILSLENNYRASWRSVVLHLAISSILFMIGDFPFYAGSVFIIALYLLFALGLLLSRFTLTYFQHKLPNLFNIKKSVAILGNTSSVPRLQRYFTTNHYHYCLHNTSFWDDTLIDENNSLQLPLFEAQFKRYAQNGVDEIYLSLGEQQMAQAQTLVPIAEKFCLHLNFVPSIDYFKGVRYEVRYIGNQPIIEVGTVPMYSVHNQAKKRIFDLFFSLLVCTFILSWLVPMVALLIRMESKGPIFFKQLRSGRNNKPFYCYKFRSMVVNKESDTQQATSGDKRITRMGRFIRKTNIDELPQFWNVLMGNMSVVGPRPHMLAHTEYYSKIIHRYMGRHYVKPGVTGWAQVNGYRGETKNPELMQRRIEHDIWYLENWSVMLDVRIVFMTVFNMLKGEKSAR